jgi:hypothetical protein
MHPKTKRRGGERGRRDDVQFTLLPPPRHWPQCTYAERPPSAALGRLACTRIVREPGARWEGKRVGRVCAGSLYVSGPASSTRMRRSGSAVARRLATTQPAVPPIEYDGFSIRSERRTEGRRTACDDDIVFFVNFCWRGHGVLTPPGKPLFVIRVAEPSI